MRKPTRELCIDGYNLLYALGEAFRKGTLEEQRERLEELLQDVRRRTGYTMTIVYDGRGSNHPLEERGAFSRVFTPSRMSADEWIINHLQTSPAAARNTTVVSSDRMIVSHAEAYGAQALPSESFIGKHIEKKCRKNNMHDSTGELSDSQMAIWLQRFSGDDPYAQEK